MINFFYLSFKELQRIFGNRQCKKKRTTERLSMVYTLTHPNRTAADASLVIMKERAYG